MLSPIHRQPCSSRRLLFFLILMILMSSSTEARVWQVGPSRTYTRPSAVSSLVGNGDTVEIDPATYADVCIWRANSLLLKGTGGMARLDATGMNLAEGKAIWVIKGSNTTVEIVEFQGASCPDQNGSGIRQEGPGLVIRSSYFHNNEDGIIAGADSTSNILIEYSEFGYNGYGDGYSHNMYIGGIRSFTLQHCYSHHALVGHLVKSRARTNYLLYNRLTDEATGTPSYEIDLPNAGTSTVIGNLVHQGTNTSNSTVVSYGREGIGAGYDTTIYFVNNTFVNDRSPFGAFLALQTGTRSVLINNIFYGGNLITSGGRHSGQNNWVPTGHTGDDSLQNSVVGTNPRLVNPSAYDYHLQSNSACIDSGTDPGGNLRPVYQYVHPANREPRPSQGVMDIGANEYVNVGVEETTEDRGPRFEVGIKPTPNPFTSFTMVRGQEKERFELYDIAGKRVGSYPGERIGEDLLPGVYFLRAGSSPSVTGRLLKLR